MKIAFLLVGFLLIIFGEYTESRDSSNWQDKLQADLNRMHQRLKEEAEARQKRFEADAKRRKEEAEALWKQLKVNAKRREEENKAFWKKFKEDMEKRKEQAKAQRKKFYVQLDKLKQKCAKKGFSTDEDVDYSKSTSTFTNSYDGFRHIYVHTNNLTTNKVIGSYYRLNEQDPTAEPICGKLEIEPSTSGDIKTKSIMMINGINMYGSWIDNEFVKLGKKCAAKGFSNEIDVGARRMVTIMSANDGIQHIYVQTYNPAIKKVSGSYFRIDQNGEITCGKLKIESSS